jgi:eukaryotic-like serine/threonine-protein kinase
MGATSSSRLRAVRGVIGPGTVLGNRYRLVSHLATGGMGEVWEADDTVLERSVAVKILKPELVEAGGFLERFRAEARHAAPLSDSGIASVFDYGEDEHAGATVAYLVMELIRGETLSDLLNREPVPPLHTTLALLRQCADALGAAHRGGVVHRDVKPANVMLVDGETVKMTDFGIARAVRSVPITHTGETVGTPHYMSPEQAMGSADITPAADVYSLGIIAHEMLTGSKPFERDHPAAVAMAQVRDEPPALPAWVPVGVADLIGRALSKDPVDRPQDGAEMAAELRALEQPAATPATVPMPAATAAGPEAPARRWWWAALASLLVVIIGGAALASRRDEVDLDGVPPPTTLPAAVVTPQPVAEAPPPVEPATPAAPVATQVVTAVVPEPSPEPPAKGKGQADDEKENKGKGQGKGNNGG